MTVGTSLKYIIEDDELVRRLQKGDIKAFDLIYKKYSVRIYAFALRYLKSSEESEELVQLVFLKLWENHKILKKELSFKSYLFTIAYNDICKLFRKRKYKKEYIEDILNGSTHSSSQTEEDVDYDSLLAHLQKIINLLPERQKTVFMKSKIEGKSSKEISQEIGLSPGTIDNYISQSIKFIRFKIKRESLTLILLLSPFFL